MHPEGRSGRRRRGPLDAARIEQVHVPGRPGCWKDALVISAEQFFWVPILTGAYVRDQGHPAGDVLHLSTQFGHPDDVCCQIVARFTPEHIALNFERPSKTLASSRADEHDDADLANIVVKRRTQWFAAARDRLVMRGAYRAAAGASAQQRTDGAAQKRLTFHDFLKCLIGEIRR